MSAAWDLVVVGGGHNGLTAAAYAARAGKRVLVCERCERTGGLAAGEEFHPGYHSAGLLLDTAAVRPWVVEELELGKHGLRRRAAPPLVVPERDGDGLVLADEPEGVGPDDRRRLAEFRDFVARLAPVVRRLTDRPPPDLLAPGARDLARLGLAGLALRRLGRATMSELLRVAPTSVADWLDELFAGETLKAALAAPALWTGSVGPRAPGTTANLLLAEATALQPVAGGPAALAVALERAARAAGVEIRCGCEVETILVRDGRATAVRLAGGEEIGARAVAAACDPRQLFLRLVPPAARSRRLTRDLVHYRARGTTARVDLAVAGYPELARRPGERFEAIRVGESLDEAERAADAIKYRGFSERPLLEVRVPTIETPELAPAGHHVVSMLVHFAPRRLEGGWTEERRRALAEGAIERLAEHVPGLREAILGYRALTPADIETRCGLSGGHLYHGEHALDQLLVRPVASCAGYATPIAGLFLCGAGSHPGGGLTCAPGALAAREILRASAG